MKQKEEQMDMDTQENKSIFLNGRFLVESVTDKFKSHTYCHLWKVKDGDSIEVFLPLNGNGMKYGGSSSIVNVYLNSEMRSMTVTSFLQAVNKLKLKQIK